MSGELLLTALIAVIVFSPSKLPMLVEHLTKLLFFVNKLKQQLNAFWSKQQLQLQLQENNQKAEEADKQYDKKSK